MVKVILILILTPKKVNRSNINIEESIGVTLSVYEFGRVLIYPRANHCLLYQ